jgi:hypothetical protein
MRHARERKETRKTKRAQKRARRDVLSKHAGAASVVVVNVSLLAPNNSCGQPEFVRHGFYTDRPFGCQDCGRQEVWTARQQKWWYEVAKGDVYTTAKRCRPCRRKARDRQGEARRVHLEGLARKHQQAKFFR